jgi:hypothetical protein
MEHVGLTHRLEDHGLLTATTCINFLDYNSSKISGKHIMFLLCNNLSSSVSRTCVTANKDDKPYLHSYLEIQTIYIKLLTEIINLCLI